MGTIGSTVIVLSGRLYMTNKTPMAQHLDDELVRRVVERYRTIAPELGGGLDDEVAADMEDLVAFGELLGRSRIFGH